MKTMKKAVVMCIVSSILLGIGNLIATISLKNLIDKPEVKSLVILALSWGIMALIGVLKTDSLNRYYMVSSNNHQSKLLHKISRLPFHILETKGYKEEFDKLKDNKKIEENFIGFVEKAFTAVISVAGLYILVYNKISNILLLLFSISLVVVIPLFSIINGRLSVLMYDYWQTYMKNTRKYLYISDVLSNREYIEEKKVFGFLPFFLKEFDKEFDIAVCKNRTLGKKRIRLELANDIVVFLYTIFLFSLFLYGYLNNQITIGLLISVFTYILAMLNSIFDGLKSMEYAVQYKKFNEDYRRFLTRAEEEENNKCLTEDKEIVLLASKVCFSYPNREQPVLNDISLIFKRGEKYAIVGANGAGKTTLAKLLTGLYFPQSGQIQWKSKPVVLFQDFNRYPATIKENVMLGNEKGIYELEQVEKLSGLKKVMEKIEEGYETELIGIKKGGMDLSGGEWQRVALARTLWKDSDIYILDEPTASLDPLEEIRIFKAYNEALKDKTVIYITHRLGFVKDVDKIIVLNEGRVWEVGTHDELCKIENGIYKKMFQEQGGWYENEG